jgi:Helix-turn-helix domain/LytR cell envelope-related transcriptional attenuator
MNFVMEAVQPLEGVAEHSPLARARLQRQLTVEETARRAGISEEYVRWLEEGRVYRFPSADDALLAAMLYGTALGLDNREARELAGLPVPAAPPERNPMPRLVVLGVILVALVVVAAVVLIPHGSNGSKGTASSVVLPPPWRTDVDVLNGSGDINYTRQVASRIQALGYSVRHVGRADNFSYPQTAVYFPPTCEGLALRLAKQLGVTTKPLPGGSGPCKLWVIAGPARGPGE